VQQKLAYLIKLFAVFCATALNFDQTLYTLITCFNAQNGPAAFDSLLLVQSYEFLRDNVGILHIQKLIIVSLISNAHQKQIGQFYYYSPK